MIDVYGLLDAVVKIQLAITYKQTGITLTLELVHIVRDKKEMGASFFFVEYLVALVAKSRVAHRSELINKIVIKIESHAGGKRKLGSHARRVSIEGHFKEAPQLREFLDPLHFFPYFPRRFAIDATDELGVFSSCHAALIARQPQRPGDIPCDCDAPPVGLINAGEQVHQCRFAAAIDTKEPNILVFGEDQADIAQDIMEAMPGGVELGYIVERNHSLSMRLQLARKIRIPRKRALSEQMPR